MYVLGSARVLGDETAVIGHDPPRMHVVKPRRLQYDAGAGAMHLPTMGGGPQP